MKNFVELMRQEHFEYDIKIIVFNKTIWYVFNTS